MFWKITFSFKDSGNTPCFCRTRYFPWCPPSNRNGIFSGQISLPGSNLSAGTFELRSPGRMFQWDHGNAGLTKGEWTRQVVWLCPSLFLRICMLAHQTLVCIYLHATVFITVIHVLCWKSERMIEDELTKGYSTKYGVTSVVTML